MQVVQISIHSVHNHWLWLFAFISRGKLRKLDPGAGTKVVGANAWSSITRSGTPHPARAGEYQQSKCWTIVNETMCFDQKTSKC